MFRYFLALRRKIHAHTGRDLVPAIAIGLALGGLLVISLFITLYLFVLICIAVGVICLIELFTATNTRGISVSRTLPLLSTIALPPLAFFTPFLFFPSAGFAFAATLLVQLFRSRKVMLHSVLAFLYIPITVSLFAFITSHPQGKLWVFFMLITVISCDTFSYIVGALFGKHFLIPRISPKKTWEGLVGGLVASLLFGTLTGVFLLSVSLWFSFIAATTLFCVAILGDLAESAVKRKLGIKDMSGILPGHGGMLDRVDSMLPTALPLLLFLYLQPA